MASDFDLDLYYRNDYVLPLAIKENGVLVADLTGWTVRYTVKNIKSTSADDSDAVLKKDITTHSGTGTYNTQISLADTDLSFTPAVYYHDIKVRKPTGEDYTILSGRLTLKSTVGNRTV